MAISCSAARLHNSTYPWCSRPIAYQRPARPCLAIVVGYGRYACFKHILCTSNRQDLKVSQFANAGKSSVPTASVFRQGR